MILLSTLSQSLWSALCFAIGVAIIKGLELWSKKDKSNSDWQGWDENSYS